MLTDLGVGLHRRCNSSGQKLVASRISAERPKIPLLFDHKDQPKGNRSGDEMMSAPRLSIKSPTNPIDFLMNTGNPALNCTLDGVLKISGVGAAHAASQEAYSLMRKGIEFYKSGSQIHSLPIEHSPTARRDLEKIIVKAGKEGLQWGMVAGMYAGFEYGMEKARGKQDWVCACCPCGELTHLQTCAQKNGMHGFASECNPCNDAGGIVMDETEECSSWRCIDRSHALCLRRQGQSRQNGPNRPYCERFSDCC